MQGCIIEEYVLCFIPELLQLTLLIFIQLPVTRLKQVAHLKIRNRLPYCCSCISSTITVVCEKCSLSNLNPQVDRKICA